MSPSSDDITPVLTELHENLNRQTGLNRLARRAGYSPFHFHRRFVAEVGETPKQHILRMRLERAAYLVAITSDRLASIAFSVGFQSHETFTRAFRRSFGVSPTEYRQIATAAQAERLIRNATFTGDQCVLSNVRMLSLPPQRLLCCRHSGAYAEVPLPPFNSDDRIWAPLAMWAQAQGVAHERTAWAISLDDPTITPGPKQRLDACVPIEGTVPRDGPFTVVEFAGGRYAGVEHVGRHETIAQAYRHVADAIRRSRTSTFGAGPPLQIFRHLDADPQCHRTEVYFPIVRR